MKSSLQKFGLLISLVYSVVLVCLTWTRICTISEMPLNELGDFLAGAFGPLAILWLVLGFFQQGQELKQNTKALELQAEELRNSVEQQKELVQVTKKQYQVAIDSQQAQTESLTQENMPILIFTATSWKSSGGNRTELLWLKNEGKISTNIRLEFESPVTFVRPDPIQALGEGEEVEIKFGLKGVTPESIDFQVKYDDINGDEHLEKYQWFQYQKGDVRDSSVKRIRE